MTYKAHIPTEEYGFVEIETNNLQDLYNEYADVKAHFSDKVGLNTQKWAQVRDKYITLGEISPEDHEQMSQAQRYVINEVKKTIKKHG